jgi:hypothetical protein
VYIFKKTTTIDSKVCPGVQIVFRKMTESRRIELQSAIIGPNDKIRDLLGKIGQLKAEDQAEQRVGGTKEDTGRSLPQILKLNDELQHVVTKELNPTKVRWGVAAVKGLCLGDENEPGTIDNLLEWPSDLIEEVLEIIEDGSALSERETKNFASPSTSGAAADERANSTIAPPADATSAS